MAQRHRIGAWLTAAAILCPAALAQNTWYIDVQGTPPGTGSPSDPYTSIQYALDSPTTLDGHMLFVRPGTYAERVTVSKHVGIYSSGGALATFIEPPSPGYALLIDFDAFTYVTGFTVRGAHGPTGDGVVLRSGGLSRCIVEGNARHGVVVNYDGWANACTIVDNGNTGFLVQPVVGVGSISDSVIWGNGVLDAGLPGAGFISIDYCAGLAGWSSGGTGNVYGDPEFWNLVEHDVHLRPGSPCIDAGNPASGLDPDGTRRDIGALTYETTYAPAPAAYCTAKLNSQGCLPAIGAVGTASATSPAPFVIQAANVVDQKPGLLLLGLGKRADPFQGGTLCIAPPIKRAGAQLSGGSGPCTGTFAFDMRAYIQSGAHSGLVPGALAHVQWWHRDPLEPSGFGSGLSDALAFGVAP